MATSTQTPIRLELGGGETSQLPGGFISIDAKKSQNAGQLKEYGDGTVDEIYASHILEHFPHAVVPLVLKEWARVLKPGGRMRIAVPDFQRIIASYDMGRREPHMAYLMGGQTDKFDFHRSLFDCEALSTLMVAVGLERIKPWISPIRDCAALPISLNLEGFKAGQGADLYQFPAEPEHDDRIPQVQQATPEKTPIKIPKIAMVLSVPRLGFTDNNFCVAQLLMKVPMTYTKVTGVFWEQCIERGLSMHLEHEYDYMLTVDYDTVFTEKIFVDLVQLAMAHPEADALAPLQIKRDEHAGLFGFTERQGQKEGFVELETLDHDLCPAQTAHFGLTLFKREALLRVPKPWFLGKPSPDGSWGDGRVDPDMVFWHKWQECGNSLYIAGHIPIGHLQLVATWPAHDLRPFHQYIPEFYACGVPMVARK
jgi:SAM-dependent methyltransferase